MPPAQVQVLLGLLILSALGGGLAVWAAMGAARLQGVPILPLTPRRVVPWSGIQALATVVLFVLAPTALLSALHYGFGERSAPRGDLPPGELLPLLLADGATKVVLLGGVVIWLWLSGARRDDLGFRIEPLDLPLGVAGFLALCVIVYPLQALLQQFGKLEHPVEKVLSASSDPWTLLGMFFVAVVVAPLVEEFVFRVVLQGWLEKFWAGLRAEKAELQAAVAALPTDPANLPPPIVEAPPLPAEPIAPQEIIASPYAAESPPEAVVPPEAAPDIEYPSRVMWFPIVVTSLIFALLHAAAWPAPVPLFFLSLGLGYLYQRTHRLGPSVVMHATVNGISVLMLAVQPYVQPG